MDLAEIDRLTGGKLAPNGVDVPCPWCGPDRRSPANRRRPVLRIWRTDERFATWSCARCGEAGYAAAAGRPVRVEVQEEARAKAAEVQVKARAERLELARWLWGRRQPIAGTPAERYLRHRGYDGPMPATLAYLPPRDDHPPAMIAAFGKADEPESGVLEIDAANVRGVHITRLAPDGSGKAGTDKDKIMIGHSAGWPIVLAPMNDMLGLAIIEGIEKGLLLHEATGLGVWVAGAASRMPGLADKVPDYVDCLSVYSDDDNDGRRHATKLRDRLSARNIYAELVIRRG